MCCSLMGDHWLMRWSNPVGHRSQPPPWMNDWLRWSKTRKEPSWGYGTLRTRYPRQRQAGLFTKGDSHAVGLVHGATNRERGTNLKYAGRVAYPHHHPCSTDGVIFFVTSQSMFAAPPSHQVHLYRGLDTP